jgi:hypothetical protein
MEKKIVRRKEQIKALERKGIDEVRSNKTARCFLISSSSPPPGDFPWTDPVATSVQHV